MFSFIKNQAGAVPSAASSTLANSRQNLYKYCTIMCEFVNVLYRNFYFLGLMIFVGGWSA